ncbi:vWA domain-containing protein [Halopiger aswanensis]|nr:vWA domain-containing protein [Halopiger aswanensis]
MSPIIGLILLIGLVLAGSMLILMVGMGTNDAVKGQISAEQSEQLMVKFDKDLSTSLFDNDTRHPAYLPEEGRSELINGGELEITVSNGFYEEDLDPISIGALRYKDGSENELLYQAGGVWRVTDQTTTLISEPDIRYYEETNAEGKEVGRIDLSVTDMDGNVGNGEHTVQYKNSSSADLERVMDQVGFVRHVEITVEDPPHRDAWVDFLKSEFDATEVGTCPRQPDTNVICEDGDSITVMATIDLENSFASQVGITPTVYGGLYADSITGQHGAPFTVTGYENHDTTDNVSKDLFVVDDDFELNSGADIEGTPVVNDSITAASGHPSISPIGYAANLERGAAPSEYEYINTTENGSTAVFWLTGEENALIANMSQSVETVQPVTAKLENKALPYLEDHEDVDPIPGRGSTIDAGLYYGDELDVDEIDTSNGDVHIGIDKRGYIDISDIEITGGNQTFVYTNTDDRLTVGNIDIQPDDRAGAFWVYGTERAEVTVDDEYEGVVYAPGSEMTIEDNADITGAIVGGETKLGDDATINFDRSLRTDVPIPPENRNISVKDTKTRPPLDVTFVLDRSGSMGDIYDSGTVTGNVWQDAPLRTRRGTEALLDPRANHSIEVQYCNNGRCGYRTTIEPGNSMYVVHDRTWTTEVRVANESCDRCEVTTFEVVDGNDPTGLRGDATRDFIGLMNESNDDRAGVYEFNDRGYELHSLSDDLEAVRQSVDVTGSGYTDISAGMELALDEYRGPTSTRDRVMVVLSDGENNPRRGGSEAADQHTKRQADRAADLGVTVYTIGLGEDNIDKELLRDITTDEGEFHMIDNAEELEEIFEGIANDVIEEEADVTFEAAMEPQIDGSSNEYVLNVDEHHVTIED